MQISGPNSGPIKQEGGASGVHKQVHSDSHAYQGLRSADLILNILYTSSIIVAEKTLAKHCPTLIWVVGITEVWGLHSGKSSRRDKHENK